MVAQQYLEVLAKEPEGATKKALTHLYELYVLRCLDRDMGFLLSAKILPVSAGAAVPERMSEICRALAADSLALVDAFGIPDRLLAAPIALGMICLSTYVV